jgi:hypothetical protein
MYHFDRTLVSSELIQCIQTSPNVSLETDMVAEISQMFPRHCTAVPIMDTKKYWKRNN